MLRSSRGFHLFAGLMAAALLWPGAAANADFGPPVKKKVDCTKAENKGKPACQKHGEGLDADELYHAAYWLAKSGRYQAALDVLAGEHRSRDPRLLTVIGLATRKLGDVDAALPYYERALALDPALVATREYLGEAYLSKGDRVAAEGQLAEIERRAGRASEHYVKLAVEIAAFATGGAPRG